MRTIKKITSVILVAAMLLLALCSCDLIGGKDPSELVKDAETVLASEPYAMNMAIKYTSEDAGMQAVIDGMSTPTVKVDVDGSDFMIAMSYKYQGLRSGVTYTRIGETLYTERNDEGTITVTEEAYTIEENLALAEKLGTASNIGINDFASVSAKSFNGVSVISCTEIKDAALNVLVESLTEQLASLDAFVAIKDVTLAIQITDGRYETIILSCDYVISVDDNVYNLNMQYATEFDYDKEIVITAPVVG